MILPIVAYGDPVLKKEAEDIDKTYPELDKLIADMYETMYAAQGVGLAAPQIGRSIRLFIVDGSPFAEDDEEEDAEPDPRAEGMEHFKKVFINPVIEDEDGEEWGFNEGCLSIPKIREEVFRKERVKVSYYDENWEYHEETFEGYAARIIQHEYDHIDGILFTDHLSPLKRRLLQKRLQNISKGEVNVDYKMRFPALRKSR
ncbi:MAG: peptide deformylase [Bacteroidota bacterium]|jgi:peptide deformylase